MLTKRLVFKKLIKLESWIVQLNPRYISKINLLIPNMRKFFLEDRYNYPAFPKPRKPRLEFFLSCA
jgi:hypothetical protein